MTEERGDEALGRLAIKAVGEVKRLGLGDEDAASWVEARLRMRLAAEETEAAMERLRRPADPSAEWTVMPGGGWRYRVKTNPANMTCRYTVTVQRSLWPQKAWKTVGDRYVETGWGARRAAKSLRRRHVRRFGDS